MGGDNSPSFISTPEEESEVDQDLNKLPLRLSSFLDESNSAVSEANQRQRQRIGDDVVASFDDLHHRMEHLEEYKNKILSYTPGSLMGKTNEGPLSHFDVPKTTTLLLIGPKGSGKSSLVNKLSRMFEDNSPERAQVSYNSSVGNGTYFNQEYMIPRGSSSFCVYDTRSLSNDATENLKELQSYMTMGIHPRQPVLRNSDDVTLMASIQCKAQQYEHYSSKTRMVNFVIFVVNGVSVLEDMYNENGEDRSYTKMIKAEFSNPLLSFTDDRPAVVVTHGDLLSIRDRVRVRIYLGDLFGIPPHTQIFDIPECSDPITKMSIVDMILYCLERADRNLPHKGWSLDKIRRASRFASVFLLMLVIAALSVVVWRDVSPHISMNNTQPQAHVDTPPPPTHVVTPPPPTHVVTPPPTRLDTPPSPTRVDTPPTRTHVDTPPPQTRAVTLPRACVVDPPPRTREIDWSKVRGQVDWSKVRGLWLGSEYD